MIIAYLFSFQLAKQFGFEYETELDGECILHLYAKGEFLPQPYRSGEGAACPKPEPAQKPTSLKFITIA